MTIRDRVKDLRRVRSGDLVPHPENWRRHPDAQRGALQAALGEIGFASSIIGRELEDGRIQILDGHMRASVDPDMVVPVQIVDLDEREARILLATHDPLAAMAEGDGKALAALLEVTAMDDGELSELARTIREDFHAFADVSSADLEDAGPQVDAGDELAKKWGVERGQIWELGAHRLMCGDSTSEADVARLMAGEKAVLLATDPPYLVDYQGGNHPQSWVNKADVKDKHWDDYQDPDSASSLFADFLRVALAHCIERVPVYQWHATRRQVLVEEAWKANGLLVHQTLIWVKARAVLTRSHFMWQHEPAFYGWPQGHMPERRPPANATTVWEINQQGEQDGIHPTQKPLEIFTRPLEYHTNPGDVVLEPFSGSGSQLIAAEKLGRRCRAMEISPAFVAVGIQRWADSTGGTPRRVD